VLTGILLTILVVFIIDHVGDDPASGDIVNWGLVGEKVGASVEQAGEEIRQEVHEATKPGPRRQGYDPTVTALKQRSIAH
jgi:hypothetical protein